MIKQIDLDKDLLPQIPSDKIYNSNLESVTLLSTKLKINLSILQISFSNLSSHNEIIFKSDKAVKSLRGKNQKKTLN